MFCSQLGLEEFPVEKRWKGIYDQFLEFIHSGCKEETEESFTGFHIQTSKELRKSQEYLFCQRYEYHVTSSQQRSPFVWRDSGLHQGLPCVKVMNPRIIQLFLLMRQEDEFQACI